MKKLVAICASVSYILDVPPMLAIEDLACDRVDLTMALLFAEARVEARRFVPIIDCHASTNATIHVHVVLALLAMHGCGVRKGKRYMYLLTHCCRI